MRPVDHAQAAVVVDPLDLVGEEREGGDRRGVVGLVLAGVVDRRRQAVEVGDPAARGGDLLDPGQGGGREEGEPEAAVRGEALLRAEVVDVGLAHVDREAARAGGGVDKDESAVVGTGHPLDGGHDAGRGLVVGPRVDVDTGLGLRVRTGSGLALEDRRGAEERGLVGHRGELARELAEAEVLRALAHQPEGGDVPERRRATVAEDDLVAVGKAEQRRPGPHGRP